MNSTSSLGLLALLFAYLFFPLETGANVFAFDAVLLLLLFALRPELARQAPIRWGVFLLLASATSVVIVHSEGAWLAHHVSLLGLIGYAQRRRIRFVYYALALGLLSLLVGPRRLWHRLREQTGDRWQLKTPLAWLVPALLAAAISAPFLILYTVGNRDFARTVASLFERLGYLGDVDDYLLFFALSLTGLCVVLPLFIAGNEFGFSERSDEDPEQLIRQRRPGAKPRAILALRRHFQLAVMVFSLLNLLLLAVNLTDLRFIWLSTRNLSASTLSEFVHAGTDSLIATILMAMLLVLYFFRGNLNFYRGTASLRPLVYLWLAQNAFLAISVGIRNWYYVRSYGLAYGRIYVAFALCLVLTGVYTLYRKVRNRRSVYYLLQVNGLAAWLFLVAYGSMNWTGLITRVNLTYSTDRIDWSYLVDDLNADNYYLLRQDLRRVPAKFRKKVARKTEVRPDWRTWNYADWRNSQ